MADATVRVLIVDDEPSVTAALEMLLSGEGYHVDVARDLGRARELLAAHAYDLALIDKNLPDGTGHELAQTLLESGRDCATILMSAHASFESAVHGIRLQIADYLTKPFGDVYEVSARIERALLRLRLERENRALTEELRQKNERLEALAVRDSLTGLFNHAFFQKSCAAELQRAERSCLPVSLLFFDIDRFKEINDTCGHLGGDAVLLGIASLLSHDGRVSDTAFRLAGSEIAARYGGDEFVLLLPQTSKAGAAVKAQRLRRCIELLEVPEAGAVRFSASIGVATYPDDAKNVDALTAAADVALYAAKGAGRNRVVTYDPELRIRPTTGEPVRAGGAELDRLELCIAERRFTFHYQPIVAGNDLAVLGYEALCRPDPELFTSVVDLLTAAELTGRVTELGRALRPAALASLDTLPEPFALFVNIHPYELYDPELMESVSLALPHAHRVVFEITEHAAVEGSRRAIDRLHALREMGFRVALDDLASGYAGLNALIDLPVDFVKLDRHVVRQITTSRRVARLVQHLGEFAAAESIQLVAEGVEREDELELLRGLGCPFMQGYLFARPQPPYPTVSFGASIAPAVLSVD